MVKVQVIDEVIENLQSQLNFHQIQYNNQKKKIDDLEAERKPIKNELIVKNTTVSNRFINYNNNLNLLVTNKNNTINKISESGWWVCYVNPQLKYQAN